MNTKLFRTITNYINEIFIVTQTAVNLWDT